MIFWINNKLVLIDSIQFFRSLLNSLVKNVGKNDFRYLSQEFDNKMILKLDLVKQKGFCSYKY